MKRLSRLQQRNLVVEKAMPEVKKMVKKHGLSVVNSCISRLKEHSKKLKQLEQMKTEVANLEREI
jgi:ABC-type uncharacterized transport system substrate-binding protein